MMSLNWAASRRISKSVQGSPPGFKNWQRTPPKNWLGFGQNWSPIWLAVNPIRFRLPNASNEWPKESWTWPRILTMDRVWSVQSAVESGILGQDLRIWCNAWRESAKSGARNAVTTEIITKSNNFPRNLWTIYVRILEQSSSNPRAILNADNRWMNFWKNLGLLELAPRVFFRNNYSKDQWRS